MCIFAIDPSVRADNLVCSNPEIRSWGQKASSDTHSVMLAVAAMFVSISKARPSGYEGRAGLRFAYAVIAARTRLAITPIRSK